MWSRVESRVEQTAASPHLRVTAIAIPAAVIACRAVIPASQPAAVVWTSVKTGVVVQPELVFLRRRRVALPTRTVGVNVLRLWQLKRLPIPAESQWAVGLLAPIKIHHVKLTKIVPKTHAHYPNATAHQQYSAPVAALGDWHMSKSPMRAYRLTGRLRPARCTLAEARKGGGTQVTRHPHHLARTRTCSPPKRTRNHKHIGDGQMDE